MTGREREGSEIYALASAGDPEAFAWLMAFHGWAHRVDDFIDEEDHARLELIDLCADAVVLCSCGFYARHANVLGPILASVAEQYRMSATVSGTLADVLRVAGNQVVLAVAYLRGGRPLLRAVSERLWKFVKETQLT